MHFLTKRAKAFAIAARGKARTRTSKEPLVFLPRYCNALGEENGLVGVYPAAAVYTTSPQRVG